MVRPPTAETGTSVPPAAISAFSTPGRSAMNLRPSRSVVVASLLVVACGPAEKGAPKAAAAPAESRSAPVTPQPYSYPEPVAGHYDEVNTGKFDLVDGLAWSPAAGGTVLYATSKP